MLVLGITSVASGVLTPITTWVDPTNTDVTWTLDIANTRVTATSTSAGALYDVYITATTGTITPTTGTDSGTNGVYKAAGDLAGISIAGTWYVPSSDESIDPDPGWEQAAGMWFSFDTNTSGDLIIDFYDSAATMHTGALQATIPEPMTIVLLGLGGLFLRRRK